MDHYLSMHPSKLILMIQSSDVQVADQYDISASVNAQQNDDRSQSFSTRTELISICHMSSFTCITKPYGPL